MTVAELIEELQEVEDKQQKVYFSVLDYSSGRSYPEAVESVSVCEIRIASGAYVLGVELA